MNFSNQEILNITNTIKSCLRNKFKNYNPKGVEKPFHFRLLGRDRMELFAFIQSLNTTFGTSIFEPVAAKVSERKFNEIHYQYEVGDEISESAQREIQNIIDDLSIGKDVNKIEELNRIRKVCNSGKTHKLRPVKVDLYLKDENDEIYLFDLKTAKPNKSNFKDFKRTLLEWAAIMFHKNSSAKIHTLIAIPYNPYEPKPYQFWTVKGMIDLDQELKVAKDFWDFLGGKDAYEDLLDCFEKAGNEMRDEINKYFLRFK
ncbi:MAG: TdeIII family type II restriction endonuclease [Candidatus Cloacimonetes bacterium]|nr:TdeIII family type II restriction endonuclease [Candidatus Cloacimonadota bacterium]MCF7814455.1 TdeIII family type II restriction endonuclease [Candidatus Cloacimonadota bacterium]MCF7869030.1 TdeIII family type II restriction endonuclease [Candidatus Cloacimonadota bacterium]MCF7884425.1 TdeIII family type II restriction endonuclease [Candidatus Cloacimonadota bacterium]